MATKRQNKLTARFAVDPEKLIQKRGTLKRSQVAKALGITAQYLWMIEKGQRRCKSEIMAGMCVLYQCKMEDLLVNAT